MTSEPAWSIGKTDRFKIDASDKKNTMLANVGPGSYEKHLKDLKNEPAYTMGARVQTIDKRVAPSPNAYNIPSKMIEKTGKSMGIKLHSTLLQKGKMNVPGPGNYDVDKSKQNNYQYTFGTKGPSDLGKDNKNPGPGNYDQDSKINIESVTANKFGGGKRSSMENSAVKAVPGPGSHSPDFTSLKKKAPNFGFGSEQRKHGEVDRQKYIPGAGSYQIPSKMGQEGPKHTMHSTLQYSPERKEGGYKPGPGNYDPDISRTQKKEPAYKMGTGNRDDYEFRKKSVFQQAPGNYDPQYEAGKNKAAAWGFGSEKRSDLAGKSKNIPGAGSYDMPSVLEGPKYGMGMKLDNGLATKSLRKVPGPGQYDLQNKDNMNMKGGNKFSVGTSQRLPVVSRSIATVPGAGSYDSGTLNNKNSAPNYGFGSGQRSNIGRNNAKIPGPGSYTLNSITGKEGRGNSMHSKLEYKPIQQTGGSTPGPGNYDSSLKTMKSAPAYGLGSQQRPFIGNKSALFGPSPGAYDPNTGATQKADAAWGFGSEKRKGLAKTSQSPGPGNYTQESPNFSPSKAKFHMGQRLPDIKETTRVPGAGSYDADGKKLQKSMPAFSMGGRLQSDLGKDNRVPGPGNYDQHQKDKKAAPRYGFGTSTRANASPQRKDIGPGPGAYKVNVKVGDVPAYAMPSRTEQQKYV